MSGQVLVAQQLLANLVIETPGASLVLAANLPVANLVAVVAQGPAGPPGALDEVVETANFTAAAGSSFVLRASGLVVNLPPSPGEGVFEIVGANGDESANPHVVHAATGEAIYAAGQSAPIATVSATGLVFQFSARAGGWDVFFG